MQKEDYIFSRIHQLRIKYYNTIKTWDHLLQIRICFAIGREITIFPCETFSSRCIVGVRDTRECRKLLDFRVSARFIPARRLHRSPGVALFIPQTSKQVAPGSLGSIKCGPLKRSTRLEGKKIKIKKKRKGRVRSFGYTWIQGRSKRFGHWCDRYTTGVNIVNKSETRSIVSSARLTDRIRMTSIRGVQLGISTFQE